MLLHLERRSLIEAFVEQFRKFSSLHFPIYYAELKKVIENKLKGKVQEVSLGDESFSSNHDAEITKDSDSSFTITLTQESCEERKLFSLAHELGHLFLHFGYMIDQEKWDKIQRGERLTRNNLPTTEEAEANEFAGCLLMPRDEYNKILREHVDVNKEVDVQELAKKFNVSTAAFQVRGKILQVLK